MTVARIMKDKVGRMITAAADDSILSVAARLTRHRIGALMVLDDAGNLAGMILEGDVVRAVAAVQSCSASVTARNIMRPCILSCTPATLESELLEIMSDNHVHHLPVMSAGRLVGVVSLGDVVRLRREKICEMMVELERLAENGRFTANLKHHRNAKPKPSLACTG